MDSLADEALASSRIMAIMVGTRKVAVAPTRSAVSRNSPAANFGMITLVAPRTRWGRTKAPLPWVTGAACSITSPGWMSGSRSTRKLVTSAISVRVVRTTPLGLPVVPPL